MEMSSRYYFAYGSNMDEEQMAYRCPKAEKLGFAMVSSYRFAIDIMGVATILWDTSSYVEGVLWMISESDEERLDRYEGVANGCYHKDEIQIINGSGEAKTALVYISNRAEQYGNVNTRSTYIQNILTAAQKQGLRSPYRWHLEMYANFGHSEPMTV